MLSACRVFCRARSAIGLFSEYTGENSPLTIDDDVKSRVQPGDDVHAVRKAK